MMQIALEIRSSGPDGRFNTQDDILYKNIRPPQLPSRAMNWQNWGEKGGLNVGDVELADQYIAGQKVMKYGGKNPEDISDRVVAEWLSNPGECTLADVYGYFDAVGATPDYVPLDFTYPICWAWLREKGNKTAMPRTNFGHESSGADSWRLIPEELPPTTDPVCLWLRDVYLSYIAGKELFESKTLPIADKEQSLILKEALRQWWESVEKQR